ncbi:MAG TPA: pentapeptide repeat-containing protein [Gemmataceae bacterium]|jgi:uncharacterized protein YjbI with pentapeptide repeats
MAKQSKAKTAKGGKRPPSGKLTGKTIAFVGKFGYRDWFRDEYQAYVVAEGGSIVDIESATPDYLIAGEGRGGNPPAAVSQFQKKHPSFPVLDEADFCRLLLPAPDELAAVLRSGEREHQYWDRLEARSRRADATIDLNGVDLRGANLFGAKLESVILDGADLRKVSAHYAHFGNLHNTRFDGTDLTNAHFRDAEDCSFRKANLLEGWFGWGDADTYKTCDFTEAKLTQFRGEKCQFLQCVFEAADLSDGKMERSNFSGANLARADLSRAHCSRSKFDDANLGRAVLFRADFRNASLINADLRQADLREAILTGADLSGANIEGADFAGVVMTGAKIAGLDFSAAKNFRPPVVRVAGPKLRELAQVAAASKRFVTSAGVELGKGEHATLTLSYDTAPPTSISARSDYRRDDNQAFDRIDAPTFEQGMFNLAERWPQGTLRLDTVSARGSRSPRGQKLLELAMAAWAEAFQLEATSPQDLQRQKATQQAELEKLRQTMLKELHGGAAGVKKWNAHSEHEREQIGPLHGLNLHGAKLTGVELHNCDLQGSQFEGANLKKADLWSCKLQSTNFARADLSGARMAFIHAEGASFEGAKLAGCEVFIATLTNAVFRGADLTGTDLSRSHLEGVDFSGARLEGADLNHAYYDANTKFPAGFVPPESMEWIGPPPETPVSFAPGSMDFDAFFEQLGYKVEDARLSKALAMLKAERFQLFADVKEDVLVGVVKSQSNPGLVYSCRLGADGRFGCCTQNLNACGGLRGSLCKHLLVLVVGLTKAGRLDPATVDAWVNASKQQKPDIDKDAMSETFLRYKGAEAGEIDWRPTETIPEDYYTL